ncbi:MAG: phosphotransferase [Thermoanaerobaculales bacterium]|jgi:Ser/Thr protein kinase RdoA (MazF antagonist)|nr:phosphotransferase [Thermoanaerobaculales bacterium]
MSATPPDPTIEHIAALADEAWQVRGEVSPLGGWEDANYLLRTDDGRAYVLKIASAATTRDTLENQVALLDHLASSEVAALVPRVVLTASGRALSPVTTPQGAARWARMLTWLEGRRLVTIEERPPQLLDAIGRTLAELDLALRTFDHPHTRRTHEWDPMAAPGLADMADAMDSPVYRTRVLAHLEHFAATVVPRRNEFEHSVIHADANDHNLLARVTGDGPRLTGIIDFSDALFAPVVADLGICLAYLMLDREDPFSDAALLIRGYHTVRPLSGLEREFLPDLVLSRICSSVLHAAQGLSRDPDNDYLQVSAAPMRRLFETIDSSPADRFRHTVEAACS